MPIAFAPVGAWIKADSLTYFDDLKVQSPQ
jgi:hypothetical protein